MRKRLVQGVVLLTFGAAVGRFTFFTYGPAALINHLVGGNLEVLRGAAPQGRDPYVRRTLYLPQRPRTAWAQLVGTDQVELYVNGALLLRRKSPLGPAAIVADLTPHLREGKNVLGVVARQGTLDRPPVVSVTGAYTLDDGEHSFGTDGPWRYAEHVDCGADYWFTPEFDDSHWPMAQRERRTLRSIVPLPQGALTGPNIEKWIGPDVATAMRLNVRRGFDVPERLEYAWLRLQCTAPFRLAVNGNVLNSQENRLGTTMPVPATQWLYDLSAFVRHGANVVSLAVTTEQPPAHLRADIEVKGRSGTFYRVTSDAQWQWQSDAQVSTAPAEGGGSGVGESSRRQTGWKAGPTRGWQPCAEESGDLGILPWHSVRQQAPILLPFALALRRMAQEAGAMLLAMLLGWAAAWAVTRWPPRRVRPGRTAVGRRRLVTPSDARREDISPALLALIPATIFLTAAMVAADDPRIAAQRVYRPLWLAMALGLVVVQWIVLRRRIRSAPTRNAEAPGHHDRPSVPKPWTTRPSIVWSLFVLVFVAGAYLRVRDIAARPLSPDEVSMYRGTMGFLERCFPSIVIHPDIPVVYATTSELVYGSSALAGLVFDDERWIIRFPTAFWGTLTIFLLFWCGRNLFRPWVGVIAAALYAFSPSCIEMADYGRYYSQLQALTLLTVYFFYRTIASPGPLHRRALWLTVACFTAMFLSWEGSALIAPPLMLAAVIHRRDRLRTILADPAVWQGMLVVGAVVLLQSAHRNLVQIARPLFGSGASDVALTPMWRYPGFDLWYYVRASSWNADSWWPLLALCGGGLLALRHPFRRPARALLIIFLGVAIFQALVLPVTAQRYAYHFLPMWVLTASAALAAAGRELARVVSVGPAFQPVDDRSKIRSCRSAWLRTYAVGLSVLATLAFGVLACGLTVDFGSQRAWRFTAANLEGLKQPGQEPSVRFVLNYLQPDDIVIVNGPHVIDHYLGRDSDYWLQTQLHLQATMDDKRSIPLHRLKGAVTLRDLDHVKEVFSRHPRVWFITEPGFNSLTNLEETSAFMRRNMDVVYEDYSSLVLFGGARHRPVKEQEQNEASLKNSGSSYLP
ncbi:MAG: glycosyltransferase family 39 protein [Planctomycetota bacterium]